jgi:hypothetical protein
MAALIHTKLPNEPICNLREVAAIEQLTNLPNYPVIQNEPILLTKKSNDLSVTRKISTRFVSLSAVKRERERRFPIANLLLQTLLKPRVFQRFRRRSVSSLFSTVPTYSTLKKLIL